MNLLALCLMLAGLAVPAWRQGTARFLGGPRAVWVAAGIGTLAALAGVARAALDGIARPAWHVPDFAGWTLLILFVALMAAESSPWARHVLRDTRTEIDTLKRTGFGPDHRLPRALLVFANGVISTAAGLTMLWLLFYLFARPGSLRLPGIVDLSAAVAAGWRPCAENIALRLVAALATYAVVVVPGMNGSARWVSGSTMPRIAAGWVLVGMSGMAAACDGGGVQVAWVVAGAVSAFSAWNISLAVITGWMFLRAIGVAGF